MVWALALRVIEFMASGLALRGYRVYGLGFTV